MSPPAPVMLGALIKPVDICDYSVSLLTMALAGLCVSYHGVDIALVSAREGLLQASKNHFLDVPDPTIPDSDLLLAPIASLTETHPRELAVLSTSTQLMRHHRDAFLRKVGLSSAPKFTITHLDAYIANMKNEEVKAEPCILFVEATPKILSAQLVIIRLDQNERIVYSPRNEGSSRPYPLTDFVHRLFTWAQDRTYEVQECVLLDIPIDLIDREAIRSTLPSTCPLSVLSGEDLSKYAASYAFKNLRMLREPYEDEDDMTCETPAAISLSVNRGQPQVLIQKDEMYSCSGEAVFTAPLDQNCISVEFLLGDHKTYPADDKFTFAQLLLNRTPESSKKVDYTASAVVTETYGNHVQVSRAQDKDKAGSGFLLQISEPFSGRAWDAVKALK